MKIYHVTELYFFMIHFQHVPGGTINAKIIFVYLPLWFSIYFQEVSSQSANISKQINERKVFKKPTYSYENYMNLFSQLLFHLFL